MSELFHIVLNMSPTASYVIIFVILVRLLLKKAPKVISYALWSVAAFRLIVPFSFESMFSLLPRNTNTVPIPHDIIYQQSPQINSGIEVVDSFVNNSLPSPAVGASLNPLQIFVEEIGVYIWVLGIIALLVYSLVAVLLLKRQLKGAQLIEKNIFQANNLKTPFVLGLINPKIYLPVGLSKEEQNYILIHEQTHIHRKDHIIKTLAFLIVSVHWFNPLVWIAFILMSTDMELSCDERVLKVMNEDIKKPYANTLLSLATGRHILNGSPLAFGEGDVKGRIKNVLNYKKPRFWVIVFSIIIVTTVGAGLMVNPKAKGTEQINDFAWEFINKDIANYESNPEINIIDSKITRLELIATFGNLADAPIDVYALEYRLLPEDLSKVVIAGGMQIDEDGWLKETCSMGSPLLVVSRNSTSAEFIGTLWTGVKENGGLEPSIKELLKVKDENEIAKFVEENLAIIMSSPKQASSPYAYIQAHQEEYENIIKFGGEKALQYMLSQFESSNAEGLRGHIMMQLCKELLGVRNNVIGETRTPQEWYDALSIRQEVKLPDFEYDGSDPIEKLVYATETEKNSQPQRGFTIVAPKIFGSYEEGGLLKVFVITFSATYKLYGNVLDEVGGSVVPSAISYKKDNSGNYVLEKYEQAKDGADWQPSIKKFCTMPVSGKEIPGLADKIIDHYGNRDDIRTLRWENLFKHLKANGIKDATLFNSRGEIEFSMSNPQYIN
jgi:beta-lactamase regulating signal transducer with metallopeptidase domain